MVLLFDEDGTELFGDGNTWSALYIDTIRWMRKRFFFYDDDDVEDAGREGFVRAIGKSWSRLTSDGPDEQARNWNYAKAIARKEAKTWLRDERLHQSHERAVSELVPNGLSPEQESDFVANLYGSDDSPTTEELVVAYSERQQAAAVIEHLRETPNWSEWVKDLVSGLTQREAAAKQGVSQATIHRRRKDGLARIRPLLEEFGISKEKP